MQSETVTHSDKEETTNFSHLLTQVGLHQDRDAFIVLFKHFAPRVKSYLITNGCPPEQADELAQEALLTVWDKSASYNSEKAAASTWIFTVARNKRIDQLRKTSRPEPHPDDPFFIADNTSPEHDYDLEQEQEIVSQAIKHLPQDQAKLIHMNFFEDKSHGAIAKEMDIPLGTVKSRIRLAMNKLRDTIQGTLTRQGDAS